jgi:S1-C subfamily serine protease
MARQRCYAALAASAAAVLVFSTGGAAFAADPAPGAMSPLEKNDVSAVVILLGQTESGGLQALCTATAFEKDGKTYKFVTAAHCVAEDDVTHERVAVAQTNWYVTFDERGSKKFYPAKIVAVGYQHLGDDFTVLEVEMDREIPIIPLANADAVRGEEIVNVAAPLGLGKQLFRGHVSLDVLDRPIIEGAINWRGANLLQVSVGPGSSGSAVVSKTRGVIIAILVGNISARSSPNVVAIPVSKFQKFYKETAAKKYRYYTGDGIDYTSSKSPTVMGLLQREYLRYGVELPLEPMTLPNVP